MTTVTINDAEQALSAGAWLKQQFGIDWELACEFGHETYHFKFFDPKHATHFALRWSN